MDSKVLLTAVLLTFGGDLAHAELLVGDNVAVLVAPQGGEIEGRICNLSRGVCTDVGFADGMGTAAIDVGSGDIVGFVGEMGGAKTSYVSVAPKVGSMEWIERVVLVVAGAFIGLVGNFAITVYNDRRREATEQRTKLRTWRDGMLALVAKREAGESVKLAMDIPSGLSKKALGKVITWQVSMRDIENMIHATPEDKPALIGRARELLLDASR